MTKILYKARSADGAAIADFIDAETVAEAKLKLVAAGFADIEFMQAPQIAVLSQNLIPDDPRKQREYAELRARMQDNPGLKSGLVSVAKRARFYLLAFAALLVFAAWRADAWLIALAVIGLALPFAIYLWNRRHLDRYQRLMRANAWGDWDAVKRLAAQLRAAPTSNQLLQFDLDVRLAQIQARDGDIAGGVAALEKWRDADAKAPGLFESRLASVHSAGRDYPGYIRMMECAAQLSKNDPSRLVDVALAHARFGSSEKAIAALAQVDTSLLPSIAGSFIDWIHGLLHLRAGAFDDATAHLQASIAAFRKRALKSPAGWVGLALAAAHCALAQARGGDVVQAQRTLDGFKHILLVHADPSLLRMLRKEVPQLFPAT
ncbi:MAG TPA: hypothetical protein VL425_07990 [Rudaea sp.]|nr:hypothetical protein [Rudaea sp.]